MHYVLTLIAASVEAFPVSLADDVRTALAVAGAETRPPVWLGPAACDLFFEGIAPAAAESTARGIVQTAPLDLLAQEAAVRRKSLLVADMESTIIAQEMLDELAALKGIGAQIAAITARAMNGELDFTTALQERVGLLAGMPIASLHDTWRRATLMPGAKYLVATMRRHGARAVLVSGGFTIFTEKLRERLNFDAAFGNELEFSHGVLTGRLVPPIHGKDYKLQILHEELAGLKLPLSAALVVGDGANDIPMLAAAGEGGGMGAAFHAKPSVRDAIPLRLDHTDLTALLYMQGYRRENFVSS
jgi:phosphoserine phosphatase